MKLAIKGHPKRGNEVIEILEMLGGINELDLKGIEADSHYYVGNSINKIYRGLGICLYDYIIYSLEEFLEKFPYKVGDKVQHKGATSCGSIFEVEEMRWEENTVKYTLCLFGCNYKRFTLPAEYLQPYKEETMEEDKGNISDGYHTFNELYEYRLLYNASMFNELAKQGLYDVHKSRLHSDGEYPFGDSNWFIVMAELPTGQISNHYEMKDWDLFQIPIKEKANTYDGHTPQDVAKRLRDFLAPKPTYPKDYDECAKIMQVQCEWHLNKDYSSSYETKLDYKIHRLKMLLICRDAYWKIAGEQMSLGKPWEPDWKDASYKYFICYIKDEIWISNTRDCNRFLSFPTKEMRNVFYENFKDLIEQCKELL